MSNTLLTNDIIAKTALMEFKNNLNMAKTVKRQFENEFNPTTGGTIRVLKPTRYLVRDGAIINVQAIQQREEAFTVAVQQGVDVAITSAQLALQLSDFNRDILRPAMLRLANMVDQSIYNSSIALYNSVGTAGAAPNSFASVSAAQALMDSYGVDTDPRYIAFSPNDGAAVRNALYNTFNTGFNSEIIMKGMMGSLSGFDCFTAQNVIRPAVGTANLGSPLIAGSGQSGATLAVDGLTAAATIKAGTVFTIAGVFGMNPLTVPDGVLQNLQQFTVTADTTVSGGGTATLPINPAIVLTGPYQNVNAGPADDAVMTFVTTKHTLNVAYIPEAFTLAMVRLPDSNDEGAFRKTMVDTDANVSIRMARQYDITNDQDLIRFDIYYGVKCWPEYGVRIMGS